MIAYLLLTFFASVAYLFFAVLALRDNPRSMRNWAFALAVFSLALWAFGYTWMYAATDVDAVKFWYRVSAPGWILSPIFFLHFYMDLARAPTKAWRRAILAVAYLIAVVLLVRMQFAPVMAADFIRREYYWEEILIQPDPWFWLLLFNSAWTLILGAFLHIRRAWRSQRKVEKRQAWVVASTILLSALLIYVVNVILPMMSVRPFPSIAIVLNLVPAGIIWWAFRRYETLALTPGMASDTILEKISDSIVLFGDDGRILSFNRSAKALMPLQIGQPVQELFVDPPAELLSVLATGVSEDGRRREPFGFESTLRLPTPIPVHVEGAPFYNAFGDYMGSSLAVRDISYIHQLRGEIAERRRIQEQLEDAMQDLKRATMARTDFLTRISHEIRTPMNAILGAGELLLDTDLNVAQRDYLDFARRAGETLLGLIDNLLDLSRMEAGRFEISKAPFSPLALAEDVCRILQPEAERKGLLLRLEAERIPEMLEGDEKSLRQILLNLGGNAVKFTESGEVLLRFEVDALAEDPVLRMVVQDSGIGIEADQIDRIFQPFIQADSSITRRFGGTGLGLTIVRELVDRMKGSLVVKSEPGSFTRFEVTIPVTVLHSSAVLQQAQPALSLPPLRLLIAEDSPENRQIVAAFLKGQPVTTVFAFDGEEAVKFFLKEKFDLILMDLQMPGVDGYSATVNIRKIEKEETRPRTPIIAFTAHALSDAAARAAEVGCDGVVVKPLRRRQLFESIIEYSSFTGDAARPAVPSEPSEFSGLEEL